MVSQRPLRMWNFCYSDDTGKEIWIQTDDFTSLFEQAERLAYVHGTKLVAFGHALPLSAPPHIRKEAQDVVEMVFRCWEDAKTTLNN